MRKIVGKRTVSGTAELARLGAITISGADDSILAKSEAE